jgi:hypothetical protein
MEKRFTTAGTATRRNNNDLLRRVAVCAVVENEH